MLSKLFFKCIIAITLLFSVSALADQCYYYDDNIYDECEYDYPYYNDINVNFNTFGGFGHERHGGEHFRGGGGGHFGGHGGGFGGHGGGFGGHGGGHGGGGHGGGHR